MLIHKFPDEILGEIVFHCLQVSDKDFSACAPCSESPFRAKKQSSSLILLVCKRWCRVATLLLYESRYNPFYWTSTSTLRYFEGKPSVRDICQESEDGRRVRQGARGFSRGDTQYLRSVSHSRCIL
ncbi:hypothetical protein BD410DRAFT_47494 [Rickenella mellea]|uniref:F-box domain-containing protein n=1 Tax=Rickenella mellea TaxID=50990 RepID=A0A4R5XI17_9AGAM|nr:hypothetical protein BD410DRAFT_47494 [Rickenella mellea]